ncbi:MAG: hypothetical protein IRZ31_05455 [Thermogemmatispora sp.]|uniref:hypothetical protein n=1 Tax=Thermogemmatispora sp. TaxID=1968838 RepID=UPI001D8263E5|nr:hypothetical protein [Thermogemmatispora sp.]MBX5448938.1 hypothetical protein [Thermogemmatispora sp.]MBX5456329.1 hypothetical protein [Thermogemmatispora sp.]
MMSSLLYILKTLPAAGRLSERLACLLDEEDRGLSMVVGEPKGPYSGQRAWLMAAKATAEMAQSGVA